VEGLVVMVGVVLRGEIFQVKKLWGMG